MSKKTEVVETKTNEVLARDGKTDEEIIDTIRIVDAQKRQHQDNANKAKVVFEREMNLVTRAQGFIEVAFQWLPREKHETVFKEEEN